MALQSDAVFEAIKERVSADKAKAKAVNGVFLYKITVDGKIVKEWSKYQFQSDKSKGCAKGFFKYYCANMC